MRYISTFLMMAVLMMGTVQGQEAKLSGRIEGATIGTDIVVNVVMGNQVVPVDTVNKEEASQLMMNLNAYET